MPRKCLHLHLYNTFEKNLNLKRILISTGLLIAIAGLFSCAGQKKAAVVTTTTAEAKMEVSGKIIKTENGKDGYMATLVDAENKNYIVTISIVNLQKSGGTFKRYEVGESIWVRGTSWKDDAGTTYIKAEDIKSIP